MTGSHQVATKLKEQWKNLAINLMLIITILCKKSGGDESYCHPNDVTCSVERSKDSSEVIPQKPNLKPNKDILNPCIDLNSNCATWAKDGKCESNAGVMLYKCQKSCQVCLDLEEIFEKRGNGDDCFDRIDDCWELVQEGKCKRSIKFMKQQCPMGCGFCVPTFEVGYPQHYEKYEKTAENKLKFLQSIQSSNIYLLNQVMKNTTFMKVRTICQNNHNLCHVWALSGECETDPDYMLFECALACQRCDFLDIDIRCPVHEDSLVKLNAWKPGDLERMYLRMTNRSNPIYAKYSPTILSRPQKPVKGCRIWIATLDTFLTEPESDYLIQLAHKEGFERAETLNEIDRSVGGAHSNYMNPDRNSSNAWCISEECYFDPVMTRVMKRIARITGVPIENQEPFQFLQYVVGEFYKPHSDYTPFRFDGPRILTVFLYLNDVTEGGGTRFPNVGGLTVSPKKGKALFFSNVLNEDPILENTCAEHEARPVVQGEKYAANVWIHMREEYADGGCE